VIKKENPNAILNNGDESFLSKRVADAFRKIDSELDREVEEVSMRLNSSLKKRLQSEGILSLPSSHTTNFRESWFTRFREYISISMMQFLKTPAVGIAVVAVVSVAAVLIYQQNQLTNLERSLILAKQELESVDKTSDTAEIYAALEGATHSKLYLEKGSALISQAEALAEQAGVPLDVTTIGEGGALIGGMELRENQLLIVAGPLSAKAKAERALKVLLELPDDTEGLVAIAIIEY
jgi:hypothetical protein